MVLPAASAGLNAGWLLKKMETLYCDYLCMSLYGTLYIMFFSVLCECVPFKLKQISVKKKKKKKKERPVEFYTMNDIQTLDSVWSYRSNKLVFRKKQTKKKNPCRHKEAETCRGKRSAPNWHCHSAPSLHRRARAQRGGLKGERVEFFTGCHSVRSEFTVSVSYYAQHLKTVVN